MSALKPNTGKLKPKELSVLRKTLETIGGVQALLDIQPDLDYEVKSQMVANLNLIAQRFGCENWESILSIISAGGSISTLRE